MIEPTETEPKATLDAFSDAMLAIAREAADEKEMVKEAPHHRAVRRLDEVALARVALPRSEERAYARARTGLRTGPGSRPERRPGRRALLGRRLGATGGGSGSPGEPASSSGSSRGRPRRPNQTSVRPSTSLKSVNPSRRRKTATP